MLRYENTEDAVEVFHDTGIYRTFTRGTRNYLYQGPYLDEAAESLGMTDDEFGELISGDPVNA